jgi:hypothetical protein
MGTERGGRQTPWPGTLLAGISMVAAFTAAAQAIPGETLVTDQRDLIDCEFSQPRNKIAWVDRSGGLWIADVDPATGLFVPANGKGTLVDPDAMATSDIRLFGNGPEWISTATGDQIVYTKFAGMPKTRTNGRLALAQQLRNGTWRHDFLAPVNLARAAPYASYDWRDPSPRISYVGPNGNHYWRNLYEPTSEQRVVDYPPDQYFNAMRFAEGERGASFPMVVDGVSQVFHYDLDTGVETQLTFDAGQKDLTNRAWIWHAPEFGGARALMTVADNVELRIYREDPGQPAWVLVRSVRTPLNGIINSPEYFTYNGASYVFFVATAPPVNFPSQVFLANIDPDDPLLVQLTPDVPKRMRTDPEVFIADDGPYIYFNRQVIDLSGHQFCLSCNEGIFRAYTGLGPPQ